MNENHMTESDTTALVAQVASGEITAWSEDKKREFCGTFRDRVQVARCILEKTALNIAESALRKKFIGQRHFDRVFMRPQYHNYAFDMTRFVDLSPDELRRCSHSNLKVGGRDPQELYVIASERADLVLKSLPPLQAAVKILDPDTAQKLDRIDYLKTVGDKLKDDAEEASEPILMEELDQNMTLANFRKLVKDKDKARCAILDKLAEVGKEGSALEAIVGKKLFKGLPGLSEAVLEVVQQHLDRSKALDAMSRRVEEQVKFGDSEAALGLLKHFEQDEAEVSSSVKKTFADALEKLKLSVRKSAAKTEPKALKGAKVKST